jgi:Flp pilus assembly pilin Flp
MLLLTQGETPEEPRAPADCEPSVWRLLKRALRGRFRRGVTSLEYVVCASFILVVLVLAVQHLGSITSGLFKKDADATTNAVGS